MVGSEWIKETILNVGFTFVYLLFSAFCYFFVILFLSFFVNVKVLMANVAFKVKFMQQTPDIEFCLNLASFDEYFQHPPPEARHQRLWWRA